MDNQIELLVPAGSMANLKAAVVKGADAVYIGMNRFSARDFATNFNGDYLRKAVNICKSNNTKLYLTMNTLVRADELVSFFNQLSYAYSMGIDAVILQEISFVNSIKKTFPDLKIHISTQNNVMNSYHAKIFNNADRITLARELVDSEIRTIKNNYDKEIEIFVHGALCACLSGQCLFSSFLGGRSGNRGKCAQPCRKKYDGKYLLSTKELCLIEKLPQIINLGVDSLKIEGRMRTPSYVATVTKIYRHAIDGYYRGKFEISDIMLKELKSVFSREFTNGWFTKSTDIFNSKKATAFKKPVSLERYEPNFSSVQIVRKRPNIDLGPFEHKSSSGKKLCVRAYNSGDAISACDNGADIVYMDIFDESFFELRKKLTCKLFAVTPRIMLDSDIGLILSRIRDLKPDGLLVGNMGLLNSKLNLPMHLDYNLNIFNDIDLDYFSKFKAKSIVSPELSVRNIFKLKNKDLISFVHGKIRLMTLRHNLPCGKVKDERGGIFDVDRIFNGSQVINDKEFGLLSKSSVLVKNGINQFFIDTDKTVGDITAFYRKILDGGKPNDSKLKKNYVLGWSYRGVF